MKLTKELKQKIDNMDYETMLRRWRFAKIGEDSIFDGESGQYFSKSMFEKKEHVDYITISKKIGWEK